MRFVISVMYLFLIAFGTQTISGRASTITKANPAIDVVCQLCRPAVRYEASRELRLHHRVVRGDLSPPAGVPRGLVTALPAEATLIGRYLYRELDKGAPIREADLVSLPSVTAAEGAELEILPLEDGAALEVDSRVKLCNEEGCAAPTLRVATIVCRGGEEVEHCSAWIEVPKHLREKVEEAYASNKRALVAGPWAEPGGSE